MKTNYIAFLQQGKKIEDFTENDILIPDWVDAFIPQLYVDKDIEALIPPQVNTTHFTMQNGNKPFQQFAKVIYPLVINELHKRKLPILAANNIVRQMAMESDYGLNPRGSQGFNLGGIKWFNTTPKNYKRSKGPDGLYYVDFDNLNDYVSYHVGLLQSKYSGALNTANPTVFVQYLHPTASGVGSENDYSASYQHYLKTLPYMKSLNKYLNH